MKRYLIPFTVGVMLGLGSVPFWVGAPIVDNTAPASLVVSHPRPLPLGDQRI